MENLARKLDEVEIGLTLAGTELAEASSRCVYLEKDESGIYCVGKGVYNLETFGDTSEEGLLKGSRLDKLAMRLRWCESGGHPDCSYKIDITKGSN